MLPPSRAGVVSLHVDLAGPLTHARGIKPGLHPEHGIHIEAEGLFDPKRHFRRQGGFFVEQIGQCGPAHAKHLGRLGYAETKRLQHLLADKLAGEAAPARLLVKRADDTDWQTAVDAYGKVSPSKFAGVVVNPGDRIWLTTAGGGGWGDPAGRDHASIIEDVREGWISAERAGAHYGVTVANEGD